MNTVRHLSAPVVAAALLAAIPAAVSSARAAVPAVPGCASGDLVVWLDTNGDGAAGSVYYRLELTNLSRSRCMLRGYPGVSAVDLRGRQIGTAALREANAAVRTLALAPGRTATAVLQIADVDVFSRASCRPVTAAGLRVYPPNQTEPKVVPFPFRACSRTGPAYLHVRPVTVRG